MQREQKKEDEFMFMTKYVIEHKQNEDKAIRYTYLAIGYPGDVGFKYNKQRMFDVRWK